MRAVAEIDAEIGRLEQQLRDLHCERRETVAAHRDRVVAAFDGGREFGDIAVAFGLTTAAVQGILWRAGRTKTGRRTTAARLREACSPQAGRDRHVDDVGIAP